MAVSLSQRPEGQSSCLIPCAHRSQDPPLTCTSCAPLSTLPLRLTLRNTTCASAWAAPPTTPVSAQSSALAALQVLSHEYPPKNPVFLCHPLCHSALKAPYRNPQELRPTSTHLTSQVPEPSVQPHPPPYPPPPPNTFVERVGCCPNLAPPEPVES